MANKSLKKALDKGLSGIAVSPALENRIMALPKARQPVKRRSLVAIVVCVLLLAGTGLAATNPTFQALLAQVGDKIAQFLQPIALAAEDNGIRMEVVAALCDDRNAVVYFALQDMEGEGRLEGLIDPYDCWISGTSIGNPRTGTYDPETQTVMLSLLGYGGEPLNGQKVTFALRSFLAGRTELEDVDIGFSLDTVAEVENTSWLSAENVSGAGGNEVAIDAFHVSGGMKILPPGEQHISIPGVDFAYISNIGLIDGQLHVQLCFPQKNSSLSSSDEEANAHIDDHGDTWLMERDDVSGSRMYSSLGVYFSVDEQGTLCRSGYSIDDPHPGKVNYYEAVYPLAKDLSQYALRGYFCTNKEYIQGNWSVTFKMQAVKAFKKATCDVDLGTGRIHTLMISSMGWTILGEKRSPEANLEAEIRVEWTDGTEERFDIQYSASDDASFEYHAFGSEPLDIDRIKAVYVNGEAVELVEVK